VIRHVRYIFRLKCRTTLVQVHTPGPAMCNSWDNSGRENKGVILLRWQIYSTQTCHSNSSMTLSLRP
jgi:hypothetical protein